MKKRLSVIAAVLICGLMYTTCDLFKEVVKEPDVSLKSVEFSSIDFNGLTLLSKVDVKNDNSIDIPLPKIDWDLDVINSPFLNGVIQSNGSLKAKNSTEVEFPVSFNYVDLINAISALNNENAQYKIKMTAHIPIPELGDLSFPFEHEGKIPLMRVPDIKVASAPSASITNSSSIIPGLSTPTGGKIEFTLDMKNNSNVAVKVDDLSCVLKIGNYSLPPGGVTSKPTINAGATQKIPFTFSLSVADITAIGLTVLTGNNFNYTLTGGYKFSIPEFPLIDELLGDSFTLTK